MTAAMDFLLEGRDYAVRKAVRKGDYDVYEIYKKKKTEWERVERIATKRVIIFDDRHFDLIIHRTVTVT